MSSMTTGILIDIKKSNYEQGAKQGLPNLEGDVINRMSRRWLQELKSEILVRKKELQQHRVENIENFQKLMANYNNSEVCYLFREVKAVQEKIEKYFDKGLNRIDHQLQVNEEIHALNTGSLFSLEDLNYKEEVVVEEYEEQEMSTFTEQIDECFAPDDTQELSLPTVVIDG